MKLITPREYQDEFIHGIRTALSKHRAVLGVLPTGGGKTVCFTYITQKAIQKQSKVWILAHRKELINQASRTLESFGVKHGIVRPDITPDYTQQVQVASVQTMPNRMNRYTEPDLIIIDEAHHSISGTYRKIIDAYPNAKILGVTATPERSDGIGLGDIFEEIIIGPQIYELIEMNYLVQPIVYRPPMRVNLDSVRRHKSDYVRDDLAEAMNKPVITGDAISHYKKYAFGLPCVVFGVNVQHCKDIAQDFRSSGFSFHAIDGSMDSKERDSLIERLGTPEVMGLVSCDIISEGTDIPAIGCAVLLRPTNSVGLYIQQVGRALRTLEGKSNCIILDHVGNTVKHGMPTQHREWSLNGRKFRNGSRESEATIPTTTCPSCYGVFMDKLENCPYCLEVLPVVVPKSIQIVDGELVRAEDEARNEKKKNISERIKRARTRPALIEIATEMGYSLAWVDRMMSYRENSRRL